MPATDPRLRPPVPPPPDQRPEGSWWARRSSRLWWSLLVAAVVLIVVLWSSQPPSQEEVTYSALLEQIRGGEVSSVEIHVGTGEIEVIAADGSTFSVQGPPGGIPDTDAAVFDDNDVKRDYAAESSNWFGSLVVMLLPILLIVAVLIWMSRRAQTQLGGATAFGRSKVRVHQDERPDTTLDDVAGYEGVKQEIGEVVEFLRESGRFAEIGARIPKGVLLVGPPGTGKTLLARAIAGEAQVPFLSITGSEFLEMFVGVGAARVRDLFETARKQRPCIVFVDEIDAIGRKRGTGLGGGHDEREQALNQLLAEMDGFESTEGIVVLAATNRPDILDPALLRAGRFDRQIVVPLPTQTERAAILAVHCRDKPLAPDVDVQLVARGTPGMSGADLANLVNEAALTAVRRGAARIFAADLDAARDRVLMGIRRTSLALDADEKQVIAHHEAGHALLAQLLPYADPVHKVTILPAGMALGSTHQLPLRERYIQQRPQLDDALAVRLGGRAAEQVVFDTASSGAHDDLVAATALARTMVREWGMSERLGHMAWGSQAAVFLGEDLIHTRDYSDQTARLIDEETARILDTQAQRAHHTLQAHRRALDAVADALIEHETLTGAEIAAIIDRTEPTHGADEVVNRGRAEIDEPVEVAAP
jgi:cell division protease FtsH